MKKMKRYFVFPLLLVFAIRSGDGHKLIVVLHFDPIQEFLSGNHIVLFPADHRQYILSRKSLVIKTHILDDILHDSFGIGSIVDGKMGSQPHFLRIPT
jgi:hypothetical protein